MHCAFLSALDILCHITHIDQITNILKSYSMAKMSNLTVKYQIKIVDI